MKSYGETYMQVRKQQLELDMKQQTGSKYLLSVSYLMWSEFQDAT